MGEEGRETGGTRRRRRRGDFDWNVKTKINKYSLYPNKKKAIEASYFIFL